MEDQFFITYSGQEVQTQDINTVAEDAALADDRVFAELFRMLPDTGFGIAKGVLPYSDSTTGSGATVKPNGASGSVLAEPCRVFIGSTSLASSDAVDNWKGIRSCVYTGSTTSLTGTVAFTANSSGNSRWDLIYFRVDKDINASTVTRYVKAAGPPITETPTSLATIKHTTVVIGTVTGTPSTTPALPALPSDSGGSYYVPLAYVRIPNGFTTTSTVATTDILGAAPIMNISKSTSACTMRPATAMYSPSGALLTKSVGGSADWGSGGSRPPTFLPPTMKGSESIIVALDCQSATTANWSLPDGSVLDGSTDWRNRLFTCAVSSGGSSSLHFAWETAGTAFFPQAQAVGGVSTGAFFSIGQSFRDESGGSNRGYVAVLDDTNSLAATSTQLILFVDMTTGQLKFTTNGTLPAIMIVAIITASAPFANR